jgi:L-threonylcarbamoyladenylate synthase
MQYDETRILPVTIHDVDLQQADESSVRAIEDAITLLKRGELVVFPTETVYGLGGDAQNVQAVERIFAAKERPLSDPLIVHIANESELQQVAMDIPDSAYRLAQAFWPGPLTLVLPAADTIPRLVTAGLDKVAVRMPNHAVAQALIRAFGKPLAAPSANRFKHVSPTTAQHALADLNGRVSLVLDGGPTLVGVESTVLDLTSEVPRILRPGGTSLEALQAVFPDIEPPAVYHDGREKERDTEVGPTLSPSPGQMLVHYAPNVPTFLYRGRLDAVRHKMVEEVRLRQSQGTRVGVLIADEDVDAFQNTGAELYALGNDLEDIAAHLFAGLRVLEEVGVDTILCRDFPATGLGLAIRDRLLKAAGGNVIDC